MGFEPTHHIADGLQAFAEIWHDDFVEYWGLRQDDPPAHLDYGTWRTHRILFDIAQGFLEAAMALQPGRLDVEGVLKFFEDRDAADPREIAFVRQAIEVEMSRGIGDAVAGWRHRSLELLDVLIEPYSERSRAYLLRVARSYIYGMKPEGAVMARAVLDAALQDLLDDDEILKAGNAKHPRRVDMDDRLRHLQRERLLSREAWSAANDIRQNGNDVVHLAPGAAEDLKSTLQKLKLVFQELDQLS